MNTFEFTSCKEFLDQVQKNLNEKLKKEGKLTLGDIYDEICLERHPWGNYDMITHEISPKSDINDRWVPVKERLPENSNGNIFLCTVEPYPGAKRYVEELRFFDYGYGAIEWELPYDSFSTDYEEVFPNVIAWMPCIKNPEPYSK